MTIDEVSAFVDVEPSESAGGLVLRVGGELDLASRGRIEPALLGAIASADSVVIDLRDLTFCDSTGVALFIAAHEKAVDDGTPVVFRSVIGAVRRVFEISGVTSIFELVD